MRHTVIAAAVSFAVLPIVTGVDEFFDRIAARSDA